MSTAEQSITDGDGYKRFFELPLDRWDLFDSVNLRRSKIVLASDLNPVIDFFNAAEVGIGGRNATQAAAELNLDAIDQSRLAQRLSIYSNFAQRCAQHSPAIIRRVSGRRRRISASRRRQQRPSLCREPAVERPGRRWPRCRTQVFPPQEGLQVLRGED